MYRRNNRFEHILIEFLLQEVETTMFFTQTNHAPMSKVLDKAEVRNEDKAEKKRFCKMTNENQVETKEGTQSTPVKIRVSLSLTVPI